MNQVPTHAFDRYFLLTCRIGILRARYFSYQSPSMPREVVSGLTTFSIIFVTCPFEVGYSYQKGNDSDGVRSSHVLVIVDHQIIKPGTLGGSVSSFWRLFFPCPLRPPCPALLLSRAFQPHREEREGQQIQSHLTTIL